MRETNDNNNMHNGKEERENSFLQTKNRDMRENPDRYLSSYDLEKIEREKRRNVPPRTEHNGLRSEENSHKGQTESRKKSSSENQKSRPQTKQKTKKPADGIPFGGKRIPRRLLGIGIAAIVLIVMIIVAVACVGHGKKPAVEETQPVAAEKTYTDIFEDTLFFGNSYFITLKTYDIPQGGHFLCKIGLSINQALEYSGDDNATVLDVLKSQGYGHIVLAFGENELGWPSEQTFIDDYIELIKAIRSAAPDIKIFVLSVLPVSADVSEKNEDETNNVRIREFNEYIRIMAEDNGVVFVPPTAELYDSELNLRSEDSTDGVHLSYEYAKLWVDDLKAIMERNE